jgi:hypothetical protein
MKVSQAFAYIILSLYHAFSNCDIRTTTGTPAILYWLAALIKNRNIRNAKNLKNK